MVTFNHVDGSFKLLCTLPGTSEQSHLFELGIMQKVDDNFNVQVMITWLIWITWTSLSAAWKKAIKRNHPLT